MKKLTTYILALGLSSGLCLMPLESEAKLPKKFPKKKVASEIPQTFESVYQNEAPFNDEGFTVETRRHSAPTPKRRAIAKEDGAKIILKRNIPVKKSNRKK